jgi:phosphoribosylaminoimidazole-succinocarboxamide synthase
MTKSTGLLYEGKAKKVFLTSDPDQLIQFFKDDATAFNAQKKGTIKDKGILNNKISEHLFRLLETQGIPTHYISRLDERSMLIKKLKMIPLEVVVRNCAAGSLVKRLGLVKGEPLSPPLLELYYKNDELGDPLINDDHVRIMGLAKEDEIQIIKKHAHRINEILGPFFEQRGMILVDFKLEFGIKGGTVYLGDDRFRRDLGKVEEAYLEVFRRISQS